MWYQVIVGHNRKDNTPLSWDAVRWRTIRAAQRYGLSGFTLTSAKGWSEKWGWEDSSIIGIDTNAPHAFAKYLGWLCEQECVGLVRSDSVEWLEI